MRDGSWMLPLGLNSSNGFKGMHPQQARDMPASDVPAAAFIAITTRLVHRYTGEDGFELSIPNTHMVQLAEALVADPEVREGVCVFWGGTPGSGSRRP
jgi:glycine cleavage system aminomethyltransferase T